MTSCLPTFLIIGAAKAATTTMAVMLRDHPEVSFSKVKEPHFFSLQSQFDRGFDWYQSLFDHHTNETAIGEASTSYSRIRNHPDVIDRISNSLSDTKIIYMVRHPLDRIQSAYLEWIATANFQGTFPSLQDALTNMPVLIDSSRYFEVFDAYRREFGEANIRIVWFDEFSQAPQPVFDDVCQFLGVHNSDSAWVETKPENEKAAVISRIEKLGRNTDDIDLSWSPASREYALSELGSDTRKFLNHFDKPADFWSN
jgi:hypothetical protein